jgi:hypothetical protein
MDGLGEQQAESNWRRDCGCDDDVADHSDDSSNDLQPRAVFVRQGSWNRNILTAECSICQSGVMESKYFNSRGQYLSDRGPGIESYPRVLS